MDAFVSRPSVSVPRLGDLPALGVSVTRSLSLPAALHPVCHSPLTHPPVDGQGFSHFGRHDGQTCYRRACSSPCV